MDKLFAVILKMALLTGTPVNATLNPFSAHDSRHSSTKHFGRLNFNSQKKPEFALTSPYLTNSPSLIVINISTQKLQLFEKGKLKKSYPISTSKRGAGQLSGSRQTPLGLHQICEKIGDGAPQYAVFKGRKFTGHVWPTTTPRHLHKRDFIVTRILRLEGLEPGRNKGHNHKGRTVDSKDRAIYIHGTTMEWKLGSPATIGCIHMGSKDVIKLFDRVAVGTLVYITS